MKIKLGGRKVIHVQTREVIANEKRSGIKFSHYLDKVEERIVQAPGISERY